MHQFAFALSLRVPIINRFLTHHWWVINFHSIHRDIQRVQRSDLVDHICPSLLAVDASIVCICLPSSLFFSLLSLLHSLRCLLSTSSSRSVNPIERDWLETKCTRDAEKIFLFSFHVNTTRCVSVVTTNLSNLLSWESFYVTLWHICFLLHSFSHFLAHHLKINWLSFSFTFSHANFVLWRTEKEKRKSIKTLVVTKSPVSEKRTIGEENIICLLNDE